MAGNADGNGHGSELVFVSFGPAPDDVISVNVAGRLLATFLERDPVLFTVLLGEAQTNVRLAQRRSSGTRPGAPDLAEDRA